MQTVVADRANETLEALELLYRHKSLSNASGLSIANSNRPPNLASLPEAIFNHNQTTLTGDEVARLFADEAARSLSLQELNSLQQFLLEQISFNNTAASILEELLDSRLEAFYDEEVKLSGQSRDRLAAPGGPPNADLGLILHVQSEDYEIDKFWDPRSQTITALMEKGITPESVFEYDWHWRAQLAWHHRAGCPPKNGVKSLKIYTIGYLLRY